MVFALNVAFLTQDSYRSVISFWLLSTSFFFMEWQSEKPVCKRCKLSPSWRNLDSPLAIYLCFVFKWIPTIGTLRFRMTLLIWNVLGISQRFTKPNVPFKTMVNNCSFSSAWHPIACLIFIWFWFSWDNLYKYFRAIQLNV